MSELLSDFPKVHCPFVRQAFPVNADDWKKHGRRLQLREQSAYLVVNRVNPGYEWVFDDPDTIAVEKLDGSNVKIRTEKGRLVAVQNRLNVIDPLQIISGKTFLIEGIFQAIGRDFVQADGEQAGEVIGPKLQGNPYKLDTHLWYPFEKTITDLRYKSFHDHARTFENWSSWFRSGLASRLYTKRASKLGLSDSVMAEGVIFYNLKRKAEQKSYMAKLRRSMFDWFYSDTVRIEGYTPEGHGDGAVDEDKLD
jgi:hypothetical protein